MTRFLLYLLIFVHFNIILLLFITPFFLIFNEPFWIVKPLKRRGVVAGRYLIESIDDANKVLELEMPHLVSFDDQLLPALTADDDVEKDIERLLDICGSHHYEQKISCWKDVKPIYPTSPVE